MLYIGNHTSSSKGYAAMGRQIVKNGGNTFAFFTRNPRGGNAKAIDPADVAKFRRLPGSMNSAKSWRMRLIHRVTNVHSNVVVQCLVRGTGFLMRRSKYDNKIGAVE